MEKRELKEKIEERLPGVYSDKGMEIVLDNILVMDISVRNNVEEYLKTGEVQSMEVEGYTVESLMQERNMNPLAAYLTLDWLIREPEKAKESLSRKVDYVKFD